MHARVTTLTMDPARIDEAVRQVETDEIPRWKQIDGFKGFTLLVDRDSGKSTAVTFWESEAAMRNSAEAVRLSRERAAETGGATQPPMVERFEVAVDTMAER
jgi:heme-degrading monooxygenase HmoA